MACDNRAYQMDALSALNYKLLEVRVVDALIWISYCLFVRTGRGGYISRPHQMYGGIQFWVVP